jgi:hydrogenase expression/formation protein HypE
MAHGAGGKATQTLIEGLFVPAFESRSSPRWRTPRRERAGADVMLTTDSFVVKPIRFPGGSIGELAVNGTVNDLAVAGARPLALSLSMILEEGLPADDLRAEVAAIAAAAEAAGVEIVGGDTKVVERGHADSMYSCTTGIGLRDPRATLAADFDQARRRDLCLRLDRRARHGDHARARRVRPRRGHRVRHVLFVAVRRRVAGRCRGRLRSCVMPRAAACARC